MPDLLVVFLGHLHRGNAERFAEEPTQAHHPGTSRHRDYHVLEAHIAKRGQPIACPDAT